MSTRIQMAFGRTGISAALPERFEYSVLDAKFAAPLADPDGAIEQALDHPTGCAPLRELAAGAKSAAISVCDITRPTPNRVVLPHVLRRLEESGMARENIVILIATGLHRPATETEIREIVGDKIALNYRVENHHAQRRDEHEYLGESTGATPIWIDRRFVAADLRISAGLIEPHLMAGFSGGRKLVAPGLAGQETIKTIHSPKFMRNPAAIEGSIEWNALHRELVEIAGRAGHSFIVDVAISRDRRVAGVFAGEPRAAHARGVEFVSKALRIEMEKPVDAVITTGAGYPLDLTYYQSIKGITAASHIIKPGGRILLIAACEEGTGGPEFSALLREHGGAAQYLDAIEHSPVRIDQWQLEKLALVTRRAEIFYCVPGLTEEVRKSLWGRAFDSVPEALAAFADDLPDGARVAVIPEGPYVLAGAAAA